MRGRPKSPPRIGRVLPSSPSAIGPPSRRKTCFVSKTLILSRTSSPLNYFPTWSAAPDGTPCNTDTAGLLARYPVNATGFHLIGKETERGWEQSEDISTLLPSLMRYGVNSSVADERARKRLLAIPLAFLEGQTGLSRHTIVRARRGQPVHARSLRLLKSALLKVIPK